MAALCLVGVGIYMYRRRQADREATDLARASALPLPSGNASESTMAFYANSLAGSTAVGTTPGDLESGHQYPEPSTGVYQAVTPVADYADTTQYPNQVGGYQGGVSHAPPPAMPQYATGGLQSASPPAMQQYQGGMVGTQQDDAPPEAIPMQQMYPGSTGMEQPPIQQQQQYQEPYPGNQVPPPSSLPNPYGHGQY